MFLGIKCSATKGVGLNFCFSEIQRQVFERLRQVGPHNLYYVICGLALTLARISSIQKPSRVFQVVPECLLMCPLLAFQHFGENSSLSKNKFHSKDGAKKGGVSGPISQTGMLVTIGTYCP